MYVIVRSHNAWLSARGKSKNQIMNWRQEKIPTAREYKVM